MSELIVSGMSPHLSAGALGLSIDDHVHWWQPLSAQEVTSCRYLNAATCPECDTSMIRQGGCCSCPACGFATCGS